MNPDSEALLIVPGGVERPDAPAEEAPKPAAMVDGALLADQERSRVYVVGNVKSWPMVAPTGRMVEERTPAGLVTGRMVPELRLYHEPMTMTLRRAPGHEKVRGKAARKAEKRARRLNREQLQRRADRIGAIAAANEAPERDW